MTYIVFKNNEVVFAGDAIPTFDDDTLIVTNNLEEYRPDYSYSISTNSDGESIAVMGDVREIPHPPAEEPAE